MKKFVSKNKFLLLYAGIVFVVLIGLSSLFTSTFQSLFDEYNLITLDVKVSKMEVLSSNSVVLTFEEYPDVEYALIDNCYQIALVNGFDTKVYVGKEISIRTFPKYTDDFDMIPIVALSVDGEVILDETLGYEEFLKLFSTKGL